jgi:hypothetical protein
MIQLCARIRRGPRFCLAQFSSPRISAPVTSVPRPFRRRPRDREGVIQDDHARCEIVDIDVSRRGPGIRYDVVGRPSAVSTRGIVRAGVGAER